MRKERDFTIQHLLLDVYSDEELNVNVILPFPWKRLCADKQPHKAPKTGFKSSQGALYFFSGRKSSI